MEDVISLTPKQLKGLVYHLNEELYRYSVHNDDSRRIVTERILNMCINCYNSPNMVDSVEEQEKEQTELELAPNNNEEEGEIVEPYKVEDGEYYYKVELDSDPDNTEDLVNGLKWSDKEYGKAFKSS